MQRPNLGIQSVLLISLLGVANAECQRKLRPRYPLPARAEIVIEGRYNDVPANASEHAACDDLHTSPAHIRLLFRTNLEIDGMERHGGLDVEVACGIAGRILLDGKAYHWQLLGDEPAGVIQTDYPDGKTHMLAHRLADLSDDPKPHRISSYVDPTWPHRGRTPKCSSREHIRLFIVLYWRAWAAPEHPRPGVSSVVVPAALPGTFCRIERWWHRRSPI